MDEVLRELYQALILDHGRHPRNCKKIQHYTHSQEGYNPVCGDRLRLYLRVEDDRVIDAGFEGEGCAISVASASLMIEMVKGKTLDQTLQLFDAFHHQVTDRDLDEDMSGCLGKLTVFGGVRAFPSRIKCATLAWHTLKGSLEDQDHPQTVTTE